MVGGRRDCGSITMNFFIDMPLSPKLAEWLVSRGHDVVHAIIERIERVFNSVPVEELPYSIIVIEKKRIRRRRLSVE